MASEGQRALADRYGRWALILGGSDGLGAAFAHAAARRGMNCMLIARNPAKLRAVAAAIEARWGVEARYDALDLGDADAADRLSEMTAPLDIGLVAVNAGGDTVAGTFLESDLAAWQSLNRRNIDTLTAVCHGFGRRMAAKGSGAILLVGSDAAFGGAGLLSGYSATKAYALNFGEWLWAELRPRGIDVLNLVIGSTDTPHMRQVLEARGIAPESIDLADPAEIAGTALDRLAEGPTLILAGADDANPLRSARLRRQRTLETTRMMQNFYGVNLDERS